MLVSTDTLRMVYWSAMVRFGERAPRLATILNLPERGWRAQVLQHRARGRRLPARATIVRDKEPGEEDVAIARRLLAAHGAALQDGLGAPRGRTDLWTLLYERQRGFAALLERGDADELAAYMCNVARHRAGEGIAQGRQQFDRIVHDARYRRFLALATWDKLVALGEALGALEVENPEEVDHRATMSTDPDTLVERIAGHLGVDVAPPDVDGGMLKLETSRGAFAMSDIWAIFTAYLMQGALKDLHPGPARVCEIGGGSGRAASWSHRFGVGSYSIVDLPHAAVVQGYYLLKSLPEKRVALYGEPAADDPSTDVRVLPTRATVRDPQYDLVVNQDSFPEMHPDHVQEYVAWIRGVCPGGLLLSVNHESKARYGRRGHGLVHVSVPEAVERARGFERLQRFPYWPRKGYVVELYRVGDAAG
jgi:hypothetical protein